MLYYIYYTIDTNFVWFEVGGGGRLHSGYNILETAGINAISALNKIDYIVFYNFLLNKVKPFFFLSTQG